MDPILITIGLTFIFASFIVFLVAYLASKTWKTDTERKLDEDEIEEENEETQIISQGNRKNNKKERYAGGKADTFSHPWLISNLKGHTANVLDINISPNGKYVVTCDEDRGIILWHCKDLESKEHKCTRGKVELDSARLVKFAPDSISMILSMETSNTLAVYKIFRREGGGTRTGPVDSIKFGNGHSYDIISIGISCDGKYIMSMSSDNCVVIWDLKGNVLKTLNTKQSTLYYAAVSPCGRFVATCGFTPDVKVFSVSFDRSANFIDAIKAFDLTGHTSGVLSFDWTQDSTRMISCSKDSTWRVYDTNIEWKLGQTPYLLQSNKLDGLGSTSPEHVTLKVAPNGLSFAIALQNDVYLFSINNPQPVGVVKDIHTGLVRNMCFSLDSRLLLTCGDKHARVFLNVAGYLANVHSVREQLQKKKTSGEAHENRLKQQIESDTKILCDVGIKV